LDAIKKVPTAYGTNNGNVTLRTHYPCYKDINDPETLHFVIIIRPQTDAAKIQQVNQRFPSIQIPQEGTF
jgi:hypothetical protein